MPVLPDPIHPVLVHLPLALALLVPVAAFALLLLSRCRELPRASWALVIAMQVMLVGSAWLAMETGEAEEERVERVVSERYIEDHEERAERFLVTAVAMLVVSFAGLLIGRRGATGRAAAAVLSLVVLTTGIAVGHSGGELVYRHGAASAYVDPAPRALGPDQPHTEHD